MFNYEIIYSYLNNLLLIYGIQICMSMLSVAFIFRISGVRYFGTRRLAQ